MLASKGTQVAGWLQVPSGDALQAIVDTSTQQYTSPAAASATVAMQPRSCPDARHQAADLHATGHSGQRTILKLTTPDDDSTGSPSSHKLPALRLARGTSLPANPQVRRHPTPPACVIHPLAIAVLLHQPTVQNTLLTFCAHASSRCRPLPC